MGPMIPIFHQNPSNGTRVMAGAFTWPHLPGDWHLQFLPHFQEKKAFWLSLAWDLVSANKELWHWILDIPYSPCPSEYPSSPSKVYRCSVLMKSKPISWILPSRSMTWPCLMISPSCIRHISWNILKNSLCYNERHNSLQIEVYRVWTQMNLIRIWKSGYKKWYRSAWRKIYCLTSPDRRGEEFKFFSTKGSFLADFQQLWLFLHTSLCSRQRSMSCRKSRYENMPGA